MGVHKKYYDVCENLEELRYLIENVMCAFKDAKDYIRQLSGDFEAVRLLVMIDAQLDLLRLESIEDELSKLEHYCKQQR